MIIGLTGGIGSGKTTVAKLFAEFKNVVTYIADDEAKKLMHTSPVIQAKIIKEFGKEAYQENTLNKAYISEIVFQNPQKLEKLNAIVHPVVRQHFLDFIKKNVNKTYIVYEAAILFEANADVLCTKVITVIASKDARIQRVIQRDAVAKNDVEQRMKNQWTEAKKQLLSHYVIHNEDIEQTKLQVRKIHNILTEMY